MTTWNTINGKTIDTHTHANRAMIWDAYMGAQSVSEALANGVADDWDGYARWALSDLSGVKDSLNTSPKAVAELAGCLKRFAEDTIAKAKADYLEAVGGADEAMAHETACLSIGRDLLPACACWALNGLVTPDYWAWLIEQIDG